MILVVASMKVELEGLFGLDRSPGHWKDCKLEYTGIGRDNVYETLKTLELEPDLRALLSVGFGGSIDPGVKPGDLCLIEAVGSGDGKDKFYPDEGFTSLARSSLDGNFTDCGLLTVGSTATEPEEKRSLGSDEFSIIDRETYWIAKLADEKNVPFLGLRVVIDGVDQKLPPDCCYDGDTGKVKPGSFTSWLINNPVQIGELPRLGWNSIRARRRLGEAVNRVVPAIMR